MQKLLIVEDDQSVRNTMVMCLELEGYAVDAVASTREAIERLRAQAYPIVISDIYLDERTGIDVLRTARQQNPDCAVILMTGRGSMETVMQATEGGAFEYLAKPFEMAHMIETIKRAERTLNGDEDERRSRGHRRSAGNGNDRQFAAHDRDLQNAFLKWRRPTRRC